MIIKLSKTELENLRIKYTGPHKFSKKYVDDRNKAWTSLVEKGAQAGKHFWNGELYTFERLIQHDFEHMVIELGSFEYKDRLFKTEVGLNEIDAIYGDGHLQTHCGVNCILYTRDKKLVIGKKKSSINLEKGIFSFVNGNLNKDELEVSDFDDIIATVKNEVEEEASIVADKSKFRFHQINHFNTYFNFEFLYPLDITSDQVSRLDKDGEFISFTALSPQEIFDLNEPMLNDLKYSKWYILDLVTTLGW